MGCDIHFYVEVKQADGSWQSADKWVTDGNYAHIPYDEGYYEDRNYDLFAILANVRNGIGFAGIKTGDGFKYIAEPRGLPSDVSSKVANASELWDGDGHSHSYFTIAELLAFDWTQMTRHQGYVTCKQWKIFRETGKPTEWCGDISGSKIKKISAIEMEFICYELGKWDEYTYACAVWEETYAESVGVFLTHTVPKMKALGKDEDVRCVFWFDN